MEVTAQAERLSVENTMEEKYVIGTDVGGTTIKFGLLTESGELLEKWRIPTNLKENGNQILPEIAASILNKLEEKKIEKSRLYGVGVGVPGGVDENGLVRGAVNLGWKERDVIAELEKLLLTKVTCGNDANMAALGEQWKGAGNGYQNLVLLTLGTGLGGGIVLNGKIHNGAHGAGGEIGHICINPTETRQCNCGLYGCLEQYVSATGIVELGKKYQKAHPGKSRLMEQDDFTAKDIFDARKAGDSSAIEIVDEFNEIMGRGMAMLSAVLDPEVFVLGGGVSEAGEILISGIEKTYQKYAFYLCKDTRIRLAELGNDAGIYGAAASVLVG